MGIRPYGEKNLDENSEEEGVVFSKIAVGQTDPVPLFLHPPTHLTKAQCYLLEPGYSCCLLFLLLFLMLCLITRLPSSF